METGISLYFGDGREACEKAIARAARAGVRHAFTSLHIPEERGVDYAREARHLLGLCREAGIDLMVDVSPVTLRKLGCTRIQELSDLGVTHVRLDFGFSAAETVELSQCFTVVLNASTITRDEVRAWRSAGADLTRFAACHNFYPKPFTGLSLDELRRINERLSCQGLAVMAFVPGDGRKRGPVGEGLPTLEAHRFRSDKLALNMLELAYAGTDTVLVGDPGITESAWRGMACLSAGYIELRCDLAPGYKFLRGQVHHDRVDSSAHVFRSVESRGKLAPVAPPSDAGAGAPRSAGTLFVSNVRFGRYAGELEIARVDLPPDDRVNVVGSVVPEDRAYLPYLARGMGALLA